VYNYPKSNTRGLLTLTNYIVEYVFHRTLGLLRVEHENRVISSNTFPPDISPSIIRAVTGVSGQF
jgi:hypothetical protein